MQTGLRGRDLITGLPREVMVTDADVREAIAVSVDHLIESAKEVLETTPPELVSDIMVSLAGLAADKLMSGDYWTGAGSDLKNVRIQVINMALSGFFGPAEYSAAMKGETTPRVEQFLENCQKAV